MRKKELESLRKALIELKAKLSDSIDTLHNDALKTAGETADDLSDIPAEHMADRGSDNFIRDLKIGVLEDTDAELCDVNRALEKIELGTYGQCEHCSASIPVKRLRALPFARLCVQCKEQDEIANGQY